VRISFISEPCVDGHVTLQKVDADKYCDINWY